jgi:hypothetical protein
MPFSRTVLSRASEERMTRLEQMEALAEASSLVAQLRIAAALGPMPVYHMLHNIVRHIDTRLDAMLRGTE